MQDDSFNFEDEFDDDDIDPVWKEMIDRFGSPRNLLTS